jgi:hypothetical protein
MSVQDADSYHRSVSLAPSFDGSFPHRWQAEILPQRPMILPSRHFVYPSDAEEVEKGALEVLVQPGPADGGSTVQPFLATCALGFRDAMAPTGLWSMPDPDWLCAVSGGYAYLIDTARPERFTHVRYRPVLGIWSWAPDDSPGLLLFAGHHSILAWGRDGEAWESERLSWEGVTVERVEEARLYGRGWDLMTDRETPFVLDLTTGKRR